MPEENVDNGARIGEAAADVEDATILQSAFCRLLRSKKYFMMDAALASEAGQYMDSSNHCWCFQTQRVVGPDGGKVHPDRCQPARECYRSAFGETV